MEQILEQILEEMFLLPMYVYKLNVKRILNINYFLIHINKWVTIGNGYFIDILR